MQSRARVLHDEIIQVLQKGESLLTPADGHMRYDIIFPQPRRQRMRLFPCGPDCMATSSSRPSRKPVKAFIGTLQESLSPGITTWNAHGVMCTEPFVGLRLTGLGKVRHLVHDGAAQAPHASPAQSACSRSPQWRLRLPASMWRSLCLM